MIEMISYGVVIGVVAYVALPLLSKKVITQSSGSEADSRVGELLHEQVMAASTIDDLEFDLQTGKLSREDYDSLVADQRKIQKDADARLKDISGISSAELTEKLERDIAAERGAVSPDSTPRCPGCKTPIQPGNKFCSDCGTKLG